ncbi:MAG: hypothetical protein RBS37_12685 [Bacteroidales bacterium]|nr:hypothetical protein [Bacteroidales bacterium]
MKDHTCRITEGNPFSGLSQLAVLRDGGKNLNSLHRRMKVWVEGPYLPDHRR